MKLYHITTKDAAAEQREQGFFEVPRTFYNSRTGVTEGSYTGVWFCAEPTYYGRPIDLHRVPADLSVMEIDIPSDAPGVISMQTKSGDTLAIEWCVPKAIANQHLRPDKTPPPESI